MKELNDQTDSVVANPNDDEKTPERQRHKARASMITVNAGRGFVVEYAFYLQGLPADISLQHNREALIKLLCVIIHGIDNGNPAESVCSRSEPLGSDSQDTMRRAVCGRSFRAERGAYVFDNLLSVTTTVYRLGPKSGASFPGLRSVRNPLVICRKQRKPSLLFQRFRSLAAYAALNRPGPTCLTPLSL